MKLLIVLAAVILSACDAKPNSTSDDVFVTIPDFDDEGAPTVAVSWTLTQAVTKCGIKSFEAINGNCTDGGCYAIRLSKNTIQHGNARICLTQNLPGYAKISSKIPFWMTDVRTH